MYYVVPWTILRTLSVSVFLYRSIAAFTDLFQIPFNCAVTTAYKRRRVRKIMHRKKRKKIRIAYRKKILDLLFSLRLRQSHFQVYVVVGTVGSCTK